MAQNYWKEYFIYDVTKALTAGTGTQAFDQSIINIDADADFEMVKLTYVSTNDRIKLKMRDDSSGRYLIKTSVDIKSIGGRNVLPMGDSNSFLPFIFPIPYIIAAASNFTVDAQDQSNAANTMRLALHGSKIRRGTAPWERNWRAKLPFIVGFSAPISVAASSTSTQNIVVDIDADFMIQKLVGIRTGAALIDITENARGKSWQNTPIHIDNCIGNGAFPNIMPSPRFISRGSIITINIQNLMTIANTIDIQLIGQKLYE